MSSVFLSPQNKIDLDWDYDINDLPPIRMNIYFPGYSNKDNIVENVPIGQVDTELDNINALKERMPNKVKEEVLIGITSNSLNNKDKHNLFLEWDKGEVDINKLKKEGGVITESTRGYHFIKEASLSLEELTNEHKKWNCCQGFSKFLGLKGYSTLRVSPKEGHYLRIIDYSDGLLYNIYKNMILKLGGSYELDT